MVSIPLNIFRERLTYADTRKVCDSYTFTEKKKPKGMPRVLCAYSIEPGVITFPLRFQKKFTKWFPEAKTYTEEHLKRVNFGTLNVKLHEYQSLAVDHIIREYETKPSTYLEADTGLGKTVIVVVVIYRIGIKTLYVVPSSKGIQSHAVSEMRKFLPGAKTVGYQNEANETGDITVIIINTLRTKPREFMREFGLVIFDEASELASPANIKALFLPVKYMLGMSATPERLDGLHTAVYKFLGPPVNITSIPKVELEEFKFKITVHKVYYAGGEEYTKSQESTAGLSAILSIGKIISDPKRLDLIIEIIKKVKTGVLVFVEHRDFVQIIYNRLVKEFKESEVDAPELAAEVSTLRGGDKAEKLVATEKKVAHIIITTYRYAWRGLSFNNYTTMILGSPRRSGIKQIMGRILRINSDREAMRNIYDIIDVSSFLRHQYKDREAAYLAKGATIVKYK